MRKLILILSILMLGIWGISNADFSKTYPQTGGSGGITSGSDATLGTVTATSLSATVVEADTFKTKNPIHWDIITKKAAFDTTSSDSIEGYSHTLVSLPPAYSTFWTVKSIAAADSDSCMLAESDIPITTSPDSAKIWIKPSSTTKVSMRVMVKNAAGTVIGNHLIILTSTNWTEYKFALFTADLTYNAKYTAYIDMVLEDAETILCSNLEVW